MKVCRIPVGRMQTNCYLVSPDLHTQTLIIDPGDDADYIAGIISQKRLRPMAIMATHGHFDHIMAVCDLQTYFSIPFFINQSDQFLVSRLPQTVRYFIGKNIKVGTPAVSGYLYPDMIIKIGNDNFKLLLTPGHTPGSICLYHETDNVCFVGDTVFSGGAVGRTDHSYSDYRILENSVKHILSLPKFTRILPGHGEETTVWAETPFHRNI